jgi:hypothetical protein
MSFVKFLKSKYGKKQLLFIIGTNLVLFLLVVFFLKFYTRHDEAIQIPDLKGKTEASNET